MSWSRSATLMRHNWALLMNDPAPIVLLTAMPLVMMTFLEGTGRAVLRSAGYADASGAELIVPGMAVMFAFFGVGYIGTAFFSEHGWGTWDRLRASRASTLEIVLGKILPSAFLMLLQLIGLFAVGIVCFGMQVRGSMAGVAVMILVCVVLLVAFSMLLTATLRTANQLMAVVNLAAMVFAGIGGALAPIDVLPGWAQTLAPASPAYWMLKGFREVILEGRGLDATIVPAAVTLGFAAAMAGIAMLRFSATDEKVYDT
jgi:ABC-2 type transport system permease protein